MKMRHKQRQTKLWHEQKEKQKSQQNQNTQTYVR